MGAIFEDSLDVLLAGDLSDFREKRAAILEPAYKSYLISSDFREDSPRPSSTYLLPSSEVVVLISRCPETEAAVDLHITKVSDTFAENFIGYCPEEKCVVFKGERGLIDDFIDFIESVAGGKEVTIVLKAPEQIRMPLGGLEHGLKYEEFVARVEILECALWIGNSPIEQEEGGIHFNELAADPKLPEPITSNRMPTPDYVNITNGNSLSNEEPSNINSTNIRSPPTGASSPLSEPPSSLSTDTPSSPLSDPPSDIDEISLHNWDELYESSSSSSSSSEGAETPPSLREWE
ncbi:hypothetical protein FNYG_06296 [Fusarium nygamai]|uniref:Uncharacterized protein n=1 Tax=Gibberella nygamai TaxID=42673 RepID=A0A2K0WEJ2_GIBNY|nr:hypothetical protein FNYG_06296 [Fusarium nygamai]